MKCRILFQNLAVLAVIALVVLAALFFARPPQAAVAGRAEVIGPGKVDTLIGTTFSYQGNLKVDGRPANGTYNFIFILYDSLTGGSQIGSTLWKSSVLVSDGLFTVYLNFGDVFDGAPRYLEVYVGAGASYPYPSASQISYTKLSPRQPLVAVPYALKSNDSGVNTETWRLVNHCSYNGQYSGGYQGCQPFGLSTDGSYASYSAYYLPPSAAAKSVESIKILLSNITRPANFPGPYLKVQIRNLDGTVARQLAYVDLRTTGANIWVDLNITGHPVINSGQYLFFELSTTVVGGVPYPPLVKTYQASLDAEIQVAPATAAYP